MRRYDDAVAAALPEVAGLLAALFVGLTVLDPVVLDGDTAVVMTSAAAVPALLFAVGYVWVSRSGVPRGWGHPLTAALCLVVTGNVLLHLGLTGELWQTSNLLLVVVGLGSGLLDLRWFAAVMAACWLGWAAVVTAFAATSPSCCTGSPGWRPPACSRSWSTPRAGGAWTRSTMPARAPRTPRCTTSSPAC